MLSKVLKSSSGTARKYLHANHQLASTALKLRAAFGSCNVNALHKFGEEIEEKVLGLMQTQISKPTLRPTKEREAYSEKHDKTPKCNGCEKCGSWERDIPLMTVQEAIREAYRCLKCNDAPCQKGCSTSIDIKTFIYCI